MKHLLLLIVLLSSHTCLKAQCSTPSTVPYYEGFQSITANNQLPQCWTVSNATNCLTFTTNPTCGAFVAQAGGADAFISGGISLTAGITYSTQLQYWTNGIGNGSNFSSFSIMYGTAQSTLGMTTVTSTSNFAASILTATFTPPSTGTYYFAIRATSTATAPTPLLYWSQFRITIPCNIAPNKPSVSIANNGTLVCPNPENNATLTASGADTYTWYNGMNAGTIVATSFTASGNNTYSVAGTSTLSGCTATTSIFLNTKPGPVLAVNVVPLMPCPGSACTVAPAGAMSYTFNGMILSGTTTPTGFVFTPTVSGAYTLYGSNGWCNSSKAFNITLDVPPSLTVSAASASYCAGDAVVIQAAGADYYHWKTGSTTVNTWSAVVVPMGPTTYTVDGVDLNNCSSTATLQLVPDQCLGITGQNVEQVRIYAHSSERAIIIESGGQASIVTILNIVGQAMTPSILMEQGNAKSIDDLTPGVYFARIATGGASRMVKVLVE